METRRKTKAMQHIMVINNHLDNPDLLDKNLILDGFVTLVAQNEEEASYILDNIHPDIVIFETVTADAHSLEILDMVKKKADVPVIIITPDNEVSTLKSMYEHGADDLVKKPFDSHALSARIHAILRRWYRFHKELIVHHHRVLKNA